MVCSSRAAVELQVLMSADTLIGHIHTSNNCCGLNLPLSNVKTLRQCNAYKTHIGIVESFIGGDLRC